MWITPRFMAGFKTKPRRSNEDFVTFGSRREDSVGESIRATSKSKGQWKYLCRTITKDGETVDFYLSHTRNLQDAKTFLAKALRAFKDYERPTLIKTDKAPAYGAVIAELKGDGQCPVKLAQRKIHFLNNGLEAEHGMLKLLIRPTLDFKSVKTACATIKGFEVM